MPLLLQVLRDEALVVPPAIEEWQETLHLAEQENVLPSFLAAVRRSLLQADGSIAARLSSLERDAAVSAFWWMSELSGIVAGFHENAIPVIPLKGPLLAQRIYGDSHLRTSRDLDLLVRATHLRAARSVLAGLGFRTDFHPDDYHESWRRGTTLVELHHNVENPLAFRFDLNAFWQRAAEVSFNGKRIMQLSPQDELLFLCLHGARHRFERLSHVLDLALAFEKLSSQIALPAFGSSLSPTLLSLVVLGHAMAKNLRPGLPELLLELPPGEATHQEALAASLWHSLQSKPPTPMNWLEQHRFYVAVESTRWGRFWRSVRHLLILTSRLIQTDFDFAARYGVTHSFLVWIMRQLRLMVKIARPAHQAGGNFRARP
jgi:hypothetical protein